MNKKLFFNTMFYTMGTFMVVLMATIVTFNFINDARLFQKAVVVATADETVKTENTAVEPPEPEDFDTIQYTRTVEPPDPEPVKEDEAGIPAVEEEEKSNELIKVEVVNYSNTKNLAEMVRETLEASGYKNVSAGNVKTNNPQETLIVERNDKKAGEAIHKILKAGRVVKWILPTSKYDVTVIIGDDFKP